MFDQGPHLRFLYTFPSDRRTGGQGFFGGHTSETSTLVWCFFLTPNTPKQRLIAEMVYHWFYQRCCFTSATFSRELWKAWNCRISGTINAVADASQWLKALELFAARQLEIWVLGGCIKQLVQAKCSSSTQRLVQQIKGFTKLFFSVVNIVNCSAQKWVAESQRSAPIFVHPSACSAVLTSANLSLTYKHSTSPPPALRYSDIFGNI